MYVKIKASIKGHTTQHHTHLRDDDEVLLVIEEVKHLQDVSCVTVTCIVQIQQQLDLVEGLVHKVLLILHHLSTALVTLGDVR